MGTHSRAMLAYGVVLSGDLPEELDDFSFTKANQIDYCSFGDHENDYYVVIMEGTLFDADERHAEFIDPAKFQIPQEKIDKFKELCKKFKTQSAPKWILMSRYD
jgi:hypothetical protein